MRHALLETGRSGRVSMLLGIVAALAASVSGSATAAGGHLLPRDGSDLVGVTRYVEVAEGQDLADIARQEGMGHLEIRAANPDADFWLPEVGSRVVVPSRHILPPAERAGIVLNLPEFRLYHFPPPPSADTPAMVITHPISIGRQDWETPLGATRVTAKVVDPGWTPPASIRAEHAADGRYLPTYVPPGPNNPLGEYAMRLAVEGYLIHGTNRPYGVGMRVTHGCIRMYPEDIETLFPRVDVGTRVMILNEPVKTGWSDDGGLYLEVHAPLEEDDHGIEWLRERALERVQAATRARPARVSPEAVERAVLERSGMPVRISLP